MYTRIICILFAFPRALGPFCSCADTPRLLYVKLRLFTLGYHILQLRIVQGRSHPLLDELVHLLRCTTNEATRLKKHLQLVLDRIEVRILLNTLDQVVLQSKLFNLVRSFVRKDLHNHTRLSVTRGFFGHSK